MREVGASQILTRPQQSTEGVAPAPRLPISAHPCSMFTLTLPECSGRQKRQGGRQGWVMEGVSGDSRLRLGLPASPSRYSSRRQALVLLDSGVQRGQWVGDKWGNLEWKHKGSRTPR